MSAKNEHGLTPQQERFAVEVAMGATLTAAYRMAFPRSKLWKDSSTWSKASNLAAVGMVSARIEALRTEAGVAAAVSIERMLVELARLAFSDPRKLVDKNGKLLPLHELPDDIAAAVASVEVDEYGKVKYKLWDKGAAQDKLAKHLGLYDKDNRQKTSPLAELARALMGNVVLAGGILVEEGRHD